MGEEGVLLNRFRGDFGISCYYFGGGFSVRLGIPTRIDLAEPVGCCAGQGKKKNPEYSPGLWSAGGGTRTRTGVSPTTPSR